ncbi:MAG TPA: hypothetical protein VFL30_11830, partial [Rhodanobacteraceae bacterium]|nr:hypothetical protein [Rhodanobacteraceae bacterium]
MLLELAVGPLGEKDARHAAASKLANDAIRADAAAFVRSRLSAFSRFSEQRGGDFRGSRAQVRACDGVLTEQRLDFTPEGVVAAAVLRDNRRPPRRITVQSQIEHALDSAPILG